MIAASSANDVVLKAGIRFVPIMDTSAMRFIEHGPDVPDELIEQALTGRAVFLCGAGISRRVGLPTFKELTERIYVRLGETRANDPAEEEAFQAKAYDRTLRALEKRLLRVGDRSRVRDACAKELVPPKRKDLHDHAAVLVLSRDKAGRTRLLTTNFDTLFERAARRSSLEVISHAGKAMPRPATPGDYGILHLHGRISDKALRLPESDLILTSADFGDAYLRDGWASQYIEDRIRTGTLVLLGYSADDAALRLLLDAIDVDRERFPDLNKIYALDMATSTSKAIWSAKGTIAVEAADYESLYETVREWAKYAADPHTYTATRVAQIFHREPRDTSDFEREQLRFLIAHDDAPSLLLANNPSMAWLPILADLKLVEVDQPLLAAWIERNLENPDAVRDVVESIALLGRRVGNILEYRLTRRAAPLTEPFGTAWHLIVRYLKDRGLNGATSYDARWFDLLSRLQRGDRTTDVLEELVAVLLPTLKVSKRFTLETTRGAAASKLNDLMAVDFETDENIDVSELLRYLPVNLSASEDDRLISRLTEALALRLNELVELELEHNDSFSATDADVPSVADHTQNQYHHGFLPIVRVMAELWSRLARKDSVLAERYVSRWASSGHKLMRRLALFGAADRAVSPAVATDALAQVRPLEHFFSNVTVELFRLLHARWADLPEAARSAIEKVLSEGPPQGTFADSSAARRSIDRCRYEGIGYLVAWNLPLTPKTLSLFEDLQRRYPDWTLQPTELAGFHSWAGPARTEAEADLDGLKGKDVGEILAAATQSEARTLFGDGNAWNTLANKDPELAFSALDAEVGPHRWDAALWKPLLWSRSAAVGPGFGAKLAASLLGHPAASFVNLVDPTAAWLNTPQGLQSGEAYWKLWDRVLAHLAPSKDEHDPARYFEQSINSAVGNLTEALLKQLPLAESDPAFTAIVGRRLTSLVYLSGHNGILAQVRLAADLSYLFERAPEWTTSRLVPLFQWGHPLALAAWSARRFANTIGSPTIFGLTKLPLLEMFGRQDVPAKLKEDYSDWLVLPLLRNRTRKADYPITMMEARAALRKVGPAALWHVGHRFAVEMGGAGEDEKVNVWREVVGPVFRGTWPLDAELQTSRANFKLVQMLRATGAAFSEAVDDVIPFIAQESATQGNTLFSLKDADPLIYRQAPKKLLDLVDAIVGDAGPGSVSFLMPILDKLVEVDASVVGLPKFQRLKLLAAKET